DGEHLWLLDWEFAGAADGLYDLATITMAGGLSEERQAALLHACGYGRAGDLRLLRAMRGVVALFEASWALVQHGLRGSADFDYLAASRSMLGSVAERFDGY